MKLLIIEDEHKIAHALKHGFEQEHFVVDTAYDGLTGFDLASSESYDAIVIDRLLPGMEGLTIINNLRKQNNHTPILMLTAKAQISERVEGLQSGADDYLAKPFAFEELLARVRALLRRPTRMEKTLIMAEGVSLDTQSFDVYREKIKVQLSAKEFALLEYLMKHPGKTISKEEIIQHVWNYDADILPNNVEVFVGYLRKKLDKAFPQEKQLIHTIRGFGYKFGE